MYCNGGDTGPVVGQVSTITLLPRIYGISMNQGQIAQVSTPTATDCKGTSVTVSAYTYGVFDANGKATLNIADVVPSGTNAGKLCAGTWNRNSGAGIADYTTCNETDLSGEVYVVASGAGANSNPLPIFVHPKVASVILGNPTATADCSTSTDPSSNCCPLASQATVTADPYVGNACLSQGSTGQLVARAYDSAGANITCQVGHLTFAAQATTIVTIDENGVATAQQPGSTVITANLTQTGSSAGFFSTCPPTKISLTVPNVTSGTSSVSVDQNTTQPLSAVATDQYGTTLTGLTLDFVSTTPITVPVSTTGTVTPAFPGAAAITAFCQPPDCNTAPVNQIGLFGNGKPIASNDVNVTSPGTNSTLLWAGSTQSRYIYPVDFTNTALSAAVRLPYAPNSMVLSNDGTTMYMGTDTELMVFNASTNSLTSEFTNVAGKVLAISPDGTKIIISDPRKNLTYLYTSAGAITSTYGGVGVRAQFTQDNNTVYITMGTPDSSYNVTPNNQLLVYSSFTGWNQVSLTAPATDVAIAVPSVGAYLAGAATTARSYCSSTTIVGTPPDQSSITNVAYPLADTATIPTDRVAATNDGLHIIGATATAGGSLVDLGFSKGLPLADCPTTVAPDYFTANRGTSNTLPLGVTVSAITGVIATSDSAKAFITYTGSGSLPAYNPSTGVLSQVALTSGATAPVAAVPSADNTTLYVGTSGDNQIHLINTTTLVDDATKIIAPKLPLYNSNGTDSSTTYVTPNLIVQHPRKATS
ncbi:MAG: hypothetical protein PW789_06025 [Edaphobacter sp.]|uniref:hypothetical protein n=1 Tax=Edaphobacter sp. TaxID=1934404 RepID=UPI00238FDA7E|nr:hypothetical protein [Edaphobacter sp.]MDE1176150.1 hypothetical protein [Edaphobacter sp.]